MKRITSTTVLRKNNIEYKPFNINGVVYWTWHNGIKKGDYVFENGKPIVRVKEILNADDLVWESLDGKSSSCDSIIEFYKIIAQTQAILEGIPVINIGNYVNDLSNQYFNNLKNQSEIIPEKARWPYKLGFIAGFNQYQYTREDLEKAIELAQNYSTNVQYDEHDVRYDILKHTHSKEMILSQIDSISYIEVDENFQILEYDYN